MMVLGLGGSPPPRNGTALRAGTKRHDGGPLDWPSSAGARSSARKLKKPPPPFPSPLTHTLPRHQFSRN